MLARYAALALLAAIGASAQATITTPPSVVVCQPAQFTVSGGTAPYFLSIVPGGQIGAAALETLPNLDAAGSFTWVADIEAGTQITIVVTDSQGAPNYSDIITIQSGSDTSCLNGGGSSSGSSSSSSSGSESSAAATPSSTSAAASSSASGASSSASSARSSGSSAASSAASSASSAVSSALSSASTRLSGTSTATSATSAPTTSDSSTSATDTAVPTSSQPGSASKTLAQGALSAIALLAALVVIA